MDPAHERLFSVGARMSKPIVAAGKGPVLAGGIGLIANCHCVVAAMGSSFGLTEMRIGMFPLILFRAVAQANRESFGFDLSDFAESAQIARYDAVRQGHFTWHADD